MMKTIEEKIDLIIATQKKFDKLFYESEGERNLKEIKKIFKSAWLLEKNLSDEESVALSNVKI